MAFDLSKIGVKQNIPKVNFTSYSGVFVAPPKFGKTATASKFPNAVIVPFEDGIKGQVANIVEGFDGSWDNFLSFIDDLEEHREEIGDSIQTIVLDTANKAWDASEPYTLKKLSVADGKRYTKPSDVPHGQFYPTRDKYFSSALDRIHNLGFAILFLSHSKVKTIRPKNGEPYDVYSSTMHDRLEAIVNPLVDFMLYGENRVVDGKETRALITKGNEMASSTGNRVYISEDILFDTEEEAMEKYQEKFKATVMERLKKAGIKEDYDTISKKQQAEKMEEVKKYVENGSLEKLKEQIGEEIDRLKAAKKTGQIKDVFVELFGSPKAYQDSDNKENLEKALEHAKSIS